MSGYLQRYDLPNLFNIYDDDDVIQIVQDSGKKKLALGFNQIFNLYNR